MFLHEAQGRVRRVKRGLPQVRSIDAKLPFRTNPSKLFSSVVQVRGVAQPG